MVALPAGYVALNVVADQRLVSWLAALAIPVTGFAVAASRLVRSAPERRRTSAVRIGLGGLGGLGGGVLVLRLVSGMQPTFPQIAGAMSDSHLPAGYQRIGEDRRGDRLCRDDCRDDCPRILRYRVPPGVSDPVRDIVLSLYRHGWSPEDPLAPRGTSPAALKGGIRAHILALDGGEVQIYLDPA